MRKVLCIVLCIVLGCIVYCFCGGGSVEMERVESTCIVDCENQGASGYVVIGSDCSCIF